MTGAELAKKTAHEAITIHKQLYIKLYRAAFGNTPDCLSCTKKRDFKRFQDYYLGDKKNSTFDSKFINKKIQKMEERKYVLKRKFNSTILSYTDKKGVLTRFYGRNINDRLASEFLKNKTKQSDEEKKLMFEVMPEVVKAKSKKTTKSKEPAKSKESKKDKEPAKAKAKENKEVK